MTPPAGVASLAPFKLAPKSMQGGLVATFIPADRPRLGRVALWDSDAVDTLPQSSLDRIEVVLGDGEIHTVWGHTYDLPGVLDWLVALPRSAEVHNSFHSLAISARLALDLIARGRLLPWITDEGFDAWRIDPIDAEHAMYLDRIAQGTSAFTHCAATEAAGASGPTIASAAGTLRRFLDAVADCLVRSPSAARVLGNPAFADPVGLKVPHLKPWLTEVAQPYAAGCRLLISAIPPEEEPGIHGGFEREFSATDFADFDPGDQVAAANFDAAMQSLRRGAAPRNTKPIPNEGWFLAFSLRSSRDRTIEVGALDLWTQPYDVLEVLGDDAESEFLIGLRQASLICPLLHKAMEEAAPTGVYITEPEVLDFIDSVDELQQAGIEVRWPGYAANATIEQRRLVSAAAPSGALPSMLDLESLLTVEWEVFLNGVALTAAELETLATAKQPIVRIRNQWVVLDEAQRKRLANPPAKPSAAEVMADLAAADAEAYAAEDPGSTLFDDSSEIGADDTQYSLGGTMVTFAQAFRTLRVASPVIEPKGLNATLREYQRIGLGWLKQITDLGVGGVLADDMGLGKTIQVLALHAETGGPMLVVCPTSLLVNWEREAASFVPGATVHRYHGPNRSLPKRLTRKHIVLTTYGVVRVDHETLADKKWKHVVADEAQAMKNPRSRTAIALRQIRAGTRIALTGTPVENKLFELWSIVTWLMPGYLGSQADFRRRFVTPIERDSDPVATRRLQAMVAPILLRRKKSDPGIAPELPDKIERDVMISLTAEQITLYRATIKSAEEDLAKAKNEISRQGMVLRMLTALKQITNHPAQYLGETGPLPNRSGKLDELFELVLAAAENGESALIFTQYVKMGNLISNFLAGQGLIVGFLNGSSSIAERERLVDDFQSGTLPFLILSLKAGGTGLNLTQASHVIHYDRWWNPAVEDQATDRAYRIGQDKTVIVHRMIAAGTVEERVAEMLEAKRDLADAVLAGGEAWIGKLSNEELTELVRFDDPSVPETRGKSSRTP